MYDTSREYPNFIISIFLNWICKKIGERERRGEKMEARVSLYVMYCIEWLELGQNPSYTYIG